jgi:hypothetical protein
MKNKTRVLKLILIGGVLVLLLASTSLSRLGGSEENQFEEKYNAIVIGGTLSEAREVLSMKPGILSFDGNTIPLRMESEFDPK